MKLIYFSIILRYSIYEWILNEPILLKIVMGNLIALLFLNHMFMWNQNFSTMFFCLISWTQYLNIFFKTIMKYSVRSGKQEFLIITKSFEKLIEKVLKNFHHWCVYCSVEDYCVAPRIQNTFLSCTEQDMENLNYCTFIHTCMQPWIGRPFNSSSIAVVVHPYSSTGYSGRSPMNKLHDSNRES